MMTAPTTMLADLMPDTPAFLDDLTPESGLGLRRWTTDEYHRMAHPVIFGPEEHTELIYGEVMVKYEGVPRYFTRDEYYRLARYGILKPDERTELIYGRVIARMRPMGEPHSTTIIKTTDVLKAVFGQGYVVRPQLPMRLSTGLEPQPDVLIVPGAPDDYMNVPPSSDALLLVEVSDTTLRYDRGTKAMMYATDRIPDYWIVNLRTRTLEVRRQPEDGEYLSLDVYREGERVRSLALSGVSIAVSNLLPLARPAQQTDTTNDGRHTGSETAPAAAGHD